MQHTSELCGIWFRVMQVQWQMSYGDCIRVLLYDMFMYVERSNLACQLFFLCMIGIIKHAFPSI